MRFYLLDTALLAGFFHKRQKAVTLIAPWVKKNEAVTSILVYAEVIEYLKGLPDYQAHYAAFHRLISEIKPSPLTYPILDRYAQLRREMRQPHGKGLIGDIDTLIAATAIEEHLTLVTQDRDFERVPQLNVKLVDLKAS
jgi:predicted nucleic acid-binding protein